MAKMSLARRVSVTLLAAGVTGLAACSSSGSSTGSLPVSSATLVVVGLDNDQSRVLTEVYAQALEKGGFRVGRRDPVADLATGYSTLKSGQADLFVTYTGQLLAQVVAAEPEAAATSTTPAPATSVTTIASATTVAPTTSVAAVTGPTPPASTAVDGTTTTLAPPTSSGEATANRITAQINAIGEILPRALLFGAPSTAQDKWTIYCSNQVASANQLATMSDLAASAEHLTLADPPKFRDEIFGQQGFTTVYGATFSKVVSVDSAKVTDAITKGDADCGVVRSLDFTITDQMSVLEDDKGLATDQAVIPLLTASSATPAATQVIDAVSKALGTGDVREMMRRIVASKQAPNVVAGEWLRSSGVTTQ